jgi:ABC-type glycerol-3-phosphate transport system substrate-binding protein
MITRREVLMLIAAAGVAGSGRAALAAQPTVEVLAMAHWPVQRALKPVRDLLTKYQGRVRVTEIDIESAEGVKRLKAVGLKGHIPIVLLIDGNKSFKRADGKSVDFVEFPVAANNPMNLNGTWSIADFEAALRATLGEKSVSQ